MRQVVKVNFQTDLLTIIVMVDRMMVKLLLSGLKEVHGEGFGMLMQQPIWIVTPGKLLNHKLCVINDFVFP